MKEAADVESRTPAVMRVRGSTLQVSGWNTRKLATQSNSPNTHPRASTLRAALRPRETLCGKTEFLARRPSFSLWTLRFGRYSW